MLAMTSQVEPRDVVFAGLHTYGKHVVAMGESNVMIYGNAAEQKGEDPRIWTELHIGRSLGTYHLYVMYDQWVEEFVPGRKEPIARHPVFSFALDSVAKLVHILRGDWTHQICRDREGERVLIESVPGQEKKVFLVDYPSAGTREYDMVTSFLSRAWYSSDRHAKVYIHSYRSMNFAMSSYADGLILNFTASLQNSEIVLYTGRTVSTRNLDELKKARRQIEAVGFTVDELYRAPSDVMARFCIASARFASYWWDRDTVPLSGLAAKHRPDAGGTYTEWLEAISEKKLRALQGEMEIV